MEEFTLVLIFHQVDVGSGSCAVVEQSLRVQVKCSLLGLFILTHEPAIACTQSRSVCDYQDPRQNRIKFVMQHPAKTVAPETSSGNASDEKSIAATVPLQANPTTVPIRHADSRSVRIPFFRWFGKTGIAPGYKKMLFDVTRPSAPSPQGSEAQRPSRSDTVYLHAARHESSSLFEEDGITPASRVLYPLLATFFDHYGCHFPFYSRNAFTVLVRSGKVSALVLNSICGLSARFSPLADFQNYPPYLRGDTFAQKAKILLVPLLNLPSYDVVASILMLVWLELANNHDVGVWMYMGMACRMAMDLGMHKVREALCLEDHR